MKRHCAHRALSVCCCLLAFLVSTTLLAAGTADDLRVSDAYVRLVPPVAATTAAFMRIKNTSKANIKITGATSASAKTTELHTHVHENNMMKMRFVPEIMIPAGAEVELKPGGLHVMLMGLSTPLVEGETIRLSLKLADDSQKAVEAKVRKIDVHAPMHH